MLFRSEIIIFKILQPDARFFLTPIQPIISNICWSNRDETYSEFAKAFAPLIKVGGWFLVQQLHVFENGMLSRRKVTSVRHFIC